MNPEQTKAYLRELEELKDLAISLEQAANLLKKIRVCCLQCINDGSSESGYMAVLSDNMISLARSLCAMIFLEKPAGIPAVTRKIIELYAKSVKMFEAFPVRDSARSIIQDEVYYDISENVKILNDVTNMIRLESEADQSGKFETIKSLIVNDAKYFWPKEARELDNATDIDSIKKCIKRLPANNKSLKITDEVKYALAKNQEYLASYGQNIPEYIYRLLCQDSHGNIGMVFDQTYRDNAIFTDLIPTNSALFIGIVQACVTDIGRRWREMGDGGWSGDVR